jgi:transketolase
VHVALEGRALLEKEGIAARVISMPSWALFDEQDRAYRDRVLPPAVRARVVVEAGVRHGWERYAGPDAGFVTLERFGASAPWQRLYQELGITGDRVAAAARDAISRSRS